MIHPDEIPAWLWIPSAIALWGIWIGIRVTEERERLRRIRREFAHRD